METNLEFSSDILQPIPIEKWPSLQELLKVDWPNYSNYYYWIQNSIKWKKIYPDLALQIYSPQGKYGSDVTFVGISNFSICDVCVFTKEPSGNRLHKALIQTNRIDWSKEVTFGLVNQNVQPILFSALAFLKIDQGIEINSVTKNWIYIKPAKECANVEIRVPEECYLANLDASHVPMIYAVWPRISKNEPENWMKLLQTIVMLNKCIGLFLKEGNVLVSWVLQSEWHGLGAIQTLGPYKRRGFSKTVTNALSKQLGKEGISPIACINFGNTASENMFASLNWKPIIQSVRITMRKQTSSKGLPLKLVAKQIPSYHEPNGASNDHSVIKRNVNVLHSRI